MLCPVCSNQIAEGAAFCSTCGAPTATKAPAAAQASAADQLRASKAGNPAAADPEQQLWHGGYSAKAMYGSWLVAILVTIAAIVACVLLPNPITGMVAGALVAGLWIWLLMYYLIARLSVDYTLTS